MKDLMQGGGSHTEPHHLVLCISTASHQTSLTMIFMSQIRKQLKCDIDFKFLLVAILQDSMLQMVQHGQLQQCSVCDPGN
jgi:hypothetical protein